MSSITIIINLSRYGFKTQFIKSINAVGALVSPNGSTKNSYSPYLVRKVDFDMSPFVIIN